MPNPTLLWNLKRASPKQPVDGVTLLNFKSVLFQYNPVMGALILEFEQGDPFLKYL